MVGNRPVDVGYYWLVVVCRHSNTLPMIGIAKYRPLLLHARLMTPRHNVSQLRLISGAPAWYPGIRSRCFLKEQRGNLPFLTSRAGFSFFNWYDFTANHAGVYIDTRNNPRIVFNKISNTVGFFKSNNFLWTGLFA
jgi:hypothetical protein